MVLVHTSIEIAAPPERVREILLDFPNLTKWHQGHFKAIEYANSNTKTTVEKGDKLNVVMEGMTFQPIVLENGPGELKWRGSLPYIFTGEHSYQFHSEDGGKKTRFVQEENFTGLLSFMISVDGGKTKVGFEKLNEDLKRAAESDVAK